MRYVITGGSGYIGSRLTEKLVELEDTERVLNLDVRPPRVPWPKTEYRETDVTDRGSVDVIQEEKPDCLIHLAFILNPIHDEELQYEVDVNGTQNVLDAADRADVGHLMVASSTTAYGAFPDNPVPISEEQSVRGVPGFPYARDKAEIDRMTQLWAANHPDRVTTIVRPCMVFGPTIDNYLIRTWESFPFFPLLDGNDPPVQFVHEDDLVDGWMSLLKDRKAGAFNITGDGTINWTDTATMAGLKARKIPAKAMHVIMGTLWGLHLPKVETPPGNAAFIQYPWVASNEKLKKETGWQPKYDSRAAFESAVRARGISQ